MIRNRENKVSAGIILLSLFTVCFSLFYGVSKRIYLEPAEVIRLMNPTSSVTVWNEKGVKGRTLVLFDRKIHASMEETTLTDENFIYRAIMNNIVRKIYHIVPDSSWPEVKYTLINNPSVTYSQGIFKTTIEGTPLFVLRVREVPTLKERVLLHLNGDYWDNGDIHTITTLLKNNQLNTDLVTLSGRVSNSTVEEFKKLL